MGQAVGVTSALDHLLSLTLRATVEPHNPPNV